MGRGALRRGTQALDGVWAEPLERKGRDQIRRKTHEQCTIGKIWVHWESKAQRRRFEVLGNASKMAVLFKLNVERCSEYSGRKFKDDPTGATAAIRTQSVPENIKPAKFAKGTNKVDVMIWKEDFMDYRRKERIWAQTNPRIF